jgi:hypothetical protein
MKGQTLSVLSLVALLFMITGNMFGAVIAQNEIQESISYSANDVNQLLRAETKADMYRKNIRKELNYTHNNIAYTLSPEWDELNWDNNIPSRDTIRTEFEEAMTTGEYGIINQNRVWGCTTPNLADDPVDIIGPNEIELSLSKASISCSGGLAKATVPIEDEYTVENTQNNYLHLAEYARTLASEVRDTVPEETEDTATDSTDSCRSPDSEQAREDAKEQARDNVLSGYKQLASDAYEATEDDREEFISGAADTEYEGSHTLENPDNIESTCTYDCECEEEDEEDCTCSGTEYTYTYEYDADSLNAEYELEDSENLVPTYDINERLEFDFVYRHSLQ